MRLRGTYWIAWIFCDRWHTRRRSGRSGGSVGRPPGARRIARRGGAGDDALFDSEQSAEADTRVILGNMNAVVLKSTNRRRKSNMKKMLRSGLVLVMMAA